MKTVIFAVFLAGSLASCVYSFAGGGLPGHIRTIAIVPFDNETGQPGLGTEVQLELRQELPRSLGVRIAGESVADAVVRGKITGYEETAPSFRPAEPGGRVEVVQREVRITFEAEIYDRTENAPIWKQIGLTASGAYAPASESVERAVEVAIEQMIVRIVDGAQSQW